MSKYNLKIGSLVRSRDNGSLAGRQKVVMGSEVKADLHLKVEDPLTCSFVLFLGRNHLLRKKAQL